MRVLCAIFIIAASGFYSVLALAQAGGVEPAVGRGPIIQPSGAGTAFTHEERTPEQMEQFERANPNPPPLREIRRMPTIDPVEYERLKDEANRKMLEQRGRASKGGDIGPLQKQ